MAGSRRSSLGTTFSRFFFFFFEISRNERTNRTEQDGTNTQATPANEHREHVRFFPTRLEFVSAFKASFFSPSSFSLSLSLSRSPSVAFSVLLFISTLLSETSPSNGRPWTKTRTKHPSFGITSVQIACYIRTVHPGTPPPPPKTAVKSH